MDMQSQGMIFLIHTAEWILIFITSIGGSVGRVATDVNSKFALRFLAGLIAGGTEAAYDLISYLIGKLFSAF